MVKRREKTKREELQLCIEIYEKRYQAKDFSGQLFAEYTSAATKLRLKRFISHHKLSLIFCFKFQTCVCAIVFKSVSSPAFFKLVISAQSVELVLTELLKSSYKSPAK
jgi:hypothetical protein